MLIEWPYSVVDVVAVAVATGAIVAPVAGNYTDPEVELEADNDLLVFVVYE